MTRNSRIKNTRFGRFLWAWGLLAFAVAAATFAATRERETGQGTDSEKALPVRTIVVEPVTSYEVRRVYTGTVMPVRAADLSWTRAGEITTVHVDQGDRVQAGALLAELVASSC